MRYRLILPIAALVAALLVVPAAQAKPRAGLSEQNPAVFSDAHWKPLKLKRVRYILSWDYAKTPAERAEVSAFLTAAHAKKQDVLVEFNSHRGCYSDQNSAKKFKYKRTKACKAPSTSAYKKAVKGFRKEYPYVKTFAPWNEVNHVSQPTYKKPKLAATYYKTLKSVCKKCTILAADLLDQRNIDSYLRKFQKASKHKGRIWGLHNYNDVNRKRSKGIQRVLAVTKGQLWLTETGGFVQFKTSGFKYSTSRAAKATKYLFNLAKKYKRVKRIYVYRWFGEKRSARFDAGLVGPNGESRPGLKQFKKSIKGLPR
jgi:Glycosyl hydrolase catalytic core